MDNANPTVTNDGQFGGDLLVATESWSQATNAPDDPLQHINAIVPTDSSTPVVLSSVTGNVRDLATKSFSTPLLGRFTAVTLDATSGDCVVYFGRSQKDSQT